ncbi:MAG: hypothetical protein K2M07_05235 [Muribaculaceae bacterium]|nr:hypothetical protein [Muribaculaceae bacterium]
MKRSETIKRDTAFMKTCMRTALELSSGRFTPSAEVIVSASIRKPAPSYFVTMDNAMRKLREIINRGVSSSERITARKRMWFEILGKVRERNGISPDGIISTRILTQVLYRSRPSSFFISKDYALRLYYSINSSHRKRHANFLIH